MKNEEWIIMVKEEWENNENDENEMMKENDNNER